MNRHDTAAAIAPFIDQWGRPTFANPYGHCRPNPQFVATAQPDAISEHASGQRTKRRGGLRNATVALVTVGTSLFGVTAASAYWTAAGTGTGAATTGTLLAVTATATVSGNLIPDAAAHTVNLSITNPNAFAVTLESATGNGAITASNGCAPTGVTFTNQTGLNVSIPAGGPTAVPLAAAAAMSTASANACQGATFTIPVTISVQKP